MEEAMQFMMPMGDPEELRAAHDRAHAEAEDFSNRVWSLLSERTAEELVTMSELFQSYLGSPNIAAAIHYTLGEVVAILKLKHDVCPGCGKDHSKDLLNEIPSGDPVGHQKAQYAKESKPVSLIDTSAIKDKIDHDTFLKAYHVAELPDGRVQCALCGVIYPSLVDRMARSSDDCHGCKHKAAHG